MDRFRIVAAIAGVELRRRLRDRSLLIQGLLGPVGLALIVGLAFGSTGSADFTIDLIIVDEDRSALSMSVIDGLVDASAEPDGPPIDVRRADTRADAFEVVDDDGDPALVFPPGFGDSVLVGRPLPLEVLGSGENSIDADIAQAVAEQTAGILNAALIATAATGEPVLAPPAPALTYTETPVGGEFDAVSYFAPSMAMLFLFFTVGAGARSLMTERREGTLARVRAAPVTDRMILAGKAVAVLVAGVGSVAAVWGITTFGFGADWGDPAVVAAVMLLVVVVVAGIGALIAGVVRSDQQADAITSMVAFGLALVGGNFISPGALPDLLQRLALLTPNGVALDTLVEASAGDATIGDVVPSLVALTVMATLTVVVGVRLVAGRLR